MLIHNIGGLQSGLRHRGDQHLRAAGGGAGAVDQVDRVVGGGDGAGVGVEHHAVSGGDHTDAVANNGLTGVGAGGDTTHHAEGRHLHEGQTEIAGLGLRDDVLGAGGFVCHEDVLKGLVIRAAHTGLRHAQKAHNGGLLAGQLPDGGDEPFPLLHRHLADGLVALRGGGDGVVHIVVDADEATALVLGGVPFLSGLLLHSGRCIGAHAFQHFAHDIADLCLCQIHCHESNLLV